MSDKLAPCPFCGATVLVYVQTGVSRGRRQRDVHGNVVEVPKDLEHVGGWAVCCHTCLAHGPIQPTKPLALQEWNRHTETANKPFAHPMLFPVD